MAGLGESLEAYFYIISETYSERERLERVLEGSTTDCSPVSMIGRGKRGLTR
jgi:hypothetical protein